MCLQKGSGISLWFLRVSKVLVPDSIQVFINRDIYPECKEGFGVTEGNGGFESVLESRNTMENDSGIRSRSKECSEYGVVEEILSRSH